jgi:uncharacterized protein YbjT (DUF2867 family)
MAPRIFFPAYVSVLSRPVDSHSVPVVITGASGFIGRHAVAAFARSSPQVRAYVRRPEAVEDLRRLGAKVAIGDITNVDQLTAVMSGAHTVCHLLPPTDQEGKERYLEPVVTAAVESSVRRVLFLTPLINADPEGEISERIQAWAEEPLAGSGLEWVVIRSAPIYGPGSPWLLAMAARARRHPSIVWGTGRQVLAPLFVDDVTAVLVAADERERTSSGSWTLEGPNRVSADELADMLAGGRRFRLHIPVRNAGGGSGWPSSWPSPTMGGADGLDAAAEFGVQLTPLAEGLRRSLPA